MDLSLSLVIAAGVVLLALLAVAAGAALDTVAQRSARRRVAEDRRRIRLALEDRDRCVRCPRRPSGRCDRDCTAEQRRVRPTLES